MERAPWFVAGPAMGLITDRAQRRGAIDALRGAQREAASKVNS